MLYPSGRRLQPTGILDLMKSKHILYRQFLNAYPQIVILLIFVCLILSGKFKNRAKHSNYLAKKIVYIWRHKYIHTYRINKIIKVQLHDFFLILKTEWLLPTAQSVFVRCGFLGVYDTSYYISCMWNEWHLYIHNL